MLIISAVLLALGPGPAGAQPAGQHITAVAVMTPDGIAQYEKFEVALALDRSFTSSEPDNNPYEPDDVSVEGHFTSPGGQERPVRYGFYYADFAIDDQYLQANDARYWRALATPQPWRIRFAPDEPGTWRYTLTVRYRDGTTETLPARTFTCVPSANRGFLKVAPNRRNFIFDNGAPYFAIGSNVDYWGVSTIKAPPGIPPPAPGSPNLSYCGPGPQAEIPLLTLSESQPLGFSTFSYAAYDQVFRELQANGGNFARVWLQRFNWDMETYDPASGMNTLGYYTTHQNRLYDFDRLLTSARQHGIYLHLSLLNGFWLWSVGDKPNWPGFPYKVGLGLSQPVEFFTDPQARHFFKNRIRYVIARWGYSPSIVSYELINEGDFTDAGQTFLQTYGPSGPDFEPLRAWTIEMARYLKTLDPRHLQTLAYGPENAEEFINGYPRLFDYSVSHDYTSSFHAQVQRSFRAQVMTQLHHKPYQLQEYDYTPYISAPYEVKFHVTPWATAFNGSFGIALQLSAFANLHHPCWPAYSYYQPLARFLAATQFSSAADNKPIGNAAGTATALYGRYRAALAADPLLLMKIPATANPAYSSACDRSCPPPYYASVGLATNGYKGNQRQYLVDGITTSEDGLIEVFALKNPTQITGWVHNKTHYWFNFPHDHNGFCDTCYANPGLKTAPQTITPLRGQQLTITHLKRRGTYTVQWFYPYPGTDVDGNGNPDDGGFLPNLAVTLTATRGRLTVPIPPLVALGTDGPTSAPDYGFVITEKPNK
ncbi:DUF5060 domain-containing protein [Hymenobacter terricola]|uniref:DUF5060 domain-containing protein n=1 Tax=Hymenobacter terricola TaxID=2819236 RepID=UPI001B3103E6|nr:DUF5060 domain-containing protein [Hymenobacter terricola]